jgi:hypothetical protein
MPHRARLITTTLAFVTVTVIAAESADDLKLPTGYRTWFHVNTMVIDKASPLFEGLGGMHNVYANASAAAALKKGGSYPNGSQFVTDLHDFTITEGSYVEGQGCGQNDQGFQEICINRRLGLPVLGRGRCQEAASDRFRQAMLRVP